MEAFVSIPVTDFSLSRTRGGMKNPFFYTQFVVIGVNVTEK